MVIVLTVSAMDAAGAKARSEMRARRAMRMGYPLRAHSAAASRLSQSPLLGVGDHDFGREFALRPVPSAHADVLALRELADSVTPQRPHMDEDVGGIGSARDE